MIENDQREMWLSLPICLHQQIAAPDPISRHRSRHAMFQLSPDFKYPILVLATGVRDIGLAHRHLPARLPPPIEVMRNGATTRIGHQRFEPNEFVLDPFGFRMGNDLGAWLMARNSATASSRAQWV